VIEAAIRISSSGGLTVVTTLRPSSERARRRKAVLLLVLSDDGNPPLVGRGSSCTDRRFVDFRPGVENGPIGAEALQYRRDAIGLEGVAERSKGPQAGSGADLVRRSTDRGAHRIGNRRRDASEPASFEV